MTTDLPYDPVKTETNMQKYLKLMQMHNHLASLYRAATRGHKLDRRTVSIIWQHIDYLELDLRAEGVEL